MASATVGILRVLLTANSAEFEAAMKKAQGAAHAWSKDMKSIGQQATAVGSTLTKALTLPLVGLAASSAKAAIDFESSFAGVRKTVNATEPEFAKLAAGFRGLAKEIPINVNELNKIGEAAGQLGIKTDAILGFTEVMAKLGVTTNLSSDQAATSLARLRNITQQVGDEGFTRLGSTIVALGNNFATTESEIVDFGLRIAASGRIAGMTEPQILAIGAAMSSVGVEAEAGGTAVQKVLNGMTEAVATGGKSLEQFAKTAGMSADEFKRAYKEDASAAFSAFVSGLKTEGDQAFVTLDNLKLGNERVIRAFLSLANAGDLLNNTLKTSGQAWRDNTALTKEAEERFKTTASQLTLLWNRIQDLGITIGNALLPAIKSAVSLLGALLPIAEGMAHAFAVLPGPIQFTVVGLGAIVAAIGPLLWITGQLILATATVTAAFGKKGIAARGLAVALSTTTVAATGTTAAMTSTAGAAALLWKGLALLTNPIALIVAGLTILGVVLYKVVTAETELEKSLRESTSAFKAQTDALATSLRTYDALKTKQSLTKDETKKLDEATRDLAKSSGLSKEAFEKEEGASGKLTDALRTQLRARQDLFKVATDQMRSQVADLMSELDKARGELGKVLSGEGKKVQIDARSGVMTSRDFTTEQRVQEVQRLTQVVLGLEKQSAQAKAAFDSMVGASKGDITLAVAGAKTLSGAAQALTDKLDGMSEKLKQADQNINKLDASARQKLTEALKAGVFSMDELTAATGLTEFELKRFEDRLKGTAKAQKDATKEAKEAEKAAEALTKRLEKQADVLSKLGIVTENEVLKQLGELNELVNLAVQAGVPFEKVLAAITPRLTELQKKAAASGVSMEVFGASLDNAAAAGKRMLDAIADRVPRAVVGLTTLPGVVLDLNRVMNLGAIQAQNTADSFKYFGVQTRAELQQTARNAVAHFKTIRDSGTATPEVIQAALDKMIAALKAAGVDVAKVLKDLGVKVKVTWTTALDAVAHVAQSLGRAFDNLFGRVLQGAADVAKGIANITGATTALGAVLAAVDLGVILGKKLQPLLSLSRGKLGAALGTNKQGRDVVEAFAASFGGFDALGERLRKALPTAESERLWIALTQGVGRSNPQQAQAAIDAITTALERAEHKTATFNTSIGSLLGRVRELGSGLPASLVEYLRGLEKAGKLSRENVDLLNELVGREVDWKKIAEAVGRYGGKIEELGGSFQQARLHAEWQQLIDDMDLFERGGIAAHDILNLTKGKIIELAQQSVKFKTEIPENMRPWILSLIESGELLDENGDKITDIGKLTFGETLQTSIQLLTDAIRDLIAEFDKIPGAVSRVPARIRTTVQVDYETGDVPDLNAGARPTYASTGGVIGSLRPRYLASGGFGAIGTDTVPAMLTPGELILNEGQQGTIADSLRSAMQVASAMFTAPSLRVMASEPTDARGDSYLVLDGASLRKAFQDAVRDETPVIVQAVHGNYKGVGTDLFQRGIPVGAF